MIRWLLLILFFTQSVFANVTEDKLQTLVEQYVRKNLNTQIQNLKIKVSVPDGSFNLPDCPSTQIAYQNPQSRFMLGQQVVMASCEKPYWRVYFQVSLEGEVPVVVASREIMQNELLNDSDLTTQLMSTSQLSGQYFTSLDHFQNVRTRIYIPSSSIIRPGMMQKDFLVKRGSSVGITLKSGQIYIRMKGKALDDGMKGDSIRVQNIDSGRVIQAEVIDAMQVEVG